MEMDWYEALMAERVRLEGAVVDDPAAEITGGGTDFTTFEGDFFYDVPAGGYQVWVTIKVSKLEA
jgi:hypothetical protein